MPDVRDRPTAPQTRPVQAQHSQPPARPASPRISIDQQRAAFAWTCIVDAQARCSDMSKYTNLAKAAPALVMTNGLMQTLAFFKEKTAKEESKREKDPHHMLSAHLCRWLGMRLEGSQCGSAGAFPGQASAAYEKVMPCLFQGKSELYQRATEETFALLRWIRQFAAAAEKTGGRR